MLNKPLALTLALATSALLSLTSAALAGGNYDSPEDHYNNYVYESAEEHYDHYNYESAEEHYNHSTYSSPEEHYDNYVW
ncbi:hypothetical protein NO932_17370 [Pelagibacterium sp. 26DY04]|uniref:hypothetical protein n=1 Tax=unclassified Pelagibacterium TaxID=2623280 RepID=UPI002815B6D8|nr:MULTISPECIES: hypothetical protein [unclassified Pelagibacterium]WMT86647.1 hypothetical protein NO932_17370 [Pelagibacterium sp. 26DY04]WMT89206.1 hypothetical protein NO934_10245 [Pelagibacterium sp. H642]